MIPRFHHQRLDASVQVVFALCLSGLWGAKEASAQVFVERKPVLLEYRIQLDKGTEAIGKAEVSFEPIDTPAGRRLRVSSLTTYSFPGATAASAKVQVDETVELVCDKKGVESFKATVKTGDTERRHEAVRKGIDYNVTSTLGTKSTKKTITAGVQNTNFGMFCGAFFGKNLGAGPMFEDFPLLHPTLADHRAGQLVREGAYDIHLGVGAEIPARILWVKHLDKKTDKYWLSDDSDQILLRSEQSIDRGVLVYEIVALNGAPYPPKKAP